jgi:hypothetical protein
MSPAIAVNEQPELHPSQIFRRATQYMNQISEEKSHEERYHYRLCLGFAIAFFIMQLAISGIIVLLAGADIGNRLIVAALSTLNILLAGILKWMAANDLPQRKDTSSRNYERVTTFIHNTDDRLQAEPHQDLSELINSAQRLFDDAEAFAATHPTRIENPEPDR